MRTLLFIPQPSSFIPLFMHIKALFLRNFRSYEQALYHFSPTVNVIRGNNALGKTSVLEAIYFLITGRSFRTAQTADMIRYGANHFFVEALFEKHGIEQRLRVYYSPEERRVSYNATTYPHLSSLLGILQGVVIHPDDAAIVKGSPSVRRQLLDILLAQRDPLYVHHLTRYDRAMRQRNALLKIRSSAAIDSWEHEMANAAAYVVQQRGLATANMLESGTEHYAKISGGNEALGLMYKANGAGDSPLDDADRLKCLFRDQYKRHRSREMDLGATFTGPHKDDLMISLDGKEVRAFASEGQQRSSVVALRLAEWDQLHRASHEAPLMLIDDIGMSLDSGRRQRLVGNFMGGRQVFITTTGDDELVLHEHNIVLGREG